MQQLLFSGMTTTKWGNEVPLLNLDTKAQRRQLALQALETIIRTGGEHKNETASDSSFL
jgi:hypothetical protein